ncbi:DUF4129 domain-containing protein [Microbacterium kyungheense]|uniref:Uncharacterized protein DUF4129 n=1 Tax=Microbacterium kyungheense TaxID=1263636 RepID=A0A543FL01_9MICO|nr:DUF4129 domain-containing protein [Microbacterium kyungheense]TQM34540.1 uncharacterized protein DUF4129 [Microbacterium kyungheense]
MVLTALLRAVTASAADVPPLTPDGDEARRWAEEELSKPAYDIAEPTPFDRIARAIGDFIASLFNPQVSGDWGSVLALVATAAVVVLIVTAFVVWGVPRVSRRAAARTPLLFGEAEHRSAAALRAAAAERAQAADWEAAIVLRFRALARGCYERGVVDPPPGATVHGFARAAARVFPGLTTRLEDAATAFDDVRYLRRPGTAEFYRLIAAVDDDIATARPLAEQVPA